jgi:hypothetical protein
MHGGAFCITVGELAVSFADAMMDADGRAPRAQAYVREEPYRLSMFLIGYEEVLAARGRFWELIMVE